MIIELESLENNEQGAQGSKLRVKFQVFRAYDSYALKTWESVHESGSHPN